MAVKMEALRTFAGTEGFFKRGQQFNVRDITRAKQLSESGLAKMVEDGETAQPNVNEEQPLPEDQKPLEEDPPYDEPPPQGEKWGVKALGGGWYELPCGAKVQGWDEAKEQLLQDLNYHFEVKNSSKESDSKVRLIEPVHEPIEVVFTGEPEESSTSSNTNEPPRFEDVVKYLGGGWYELPNQERVQGKESAQDVYEAYVREGRDL